MALLMFRLSNARRDVAWPDAHLVRQRRDDGSTPNENL